MPGALLLILRSGKKCCARSERHRFQAWAHGSRSIETAAVRLTQRTAPRSRRDVGKPPPGHVVVIIVTHDLTVALVVAPHHGGGRSTRPTRSCSSPRSRSDSGSPQCKHG